MRLGEIITRTVEEHSFFQSFFVSGRKSGAELNSVTVKSSLSALLSDWLGGPELGWLGKVSAHY